MVYSECVKIGLALFGTEGAYQFGVHQQNILMKESSKDIIRVLLAIFLPPVGVFLQVGLGLHFWINVILTLLGYVPGVVHGIYIILTRGNNRTVA